MALIDWLIRDTSLIGTIYEAVREQSSNIRAETINIGSVTFLKYGITAQIKYHHRYFKVDIVPWIERYITIYPVTHDTLSFQFSGCYMARFRIRDTYYIAHIHTSSESLNEDCRSIFARFLCRYKNEIEEFQMFKPWCHRRACGIVKYWGLITRAGECYTLELNFNGPTPVVSAIYKHPHITLSGLRDNFYVMEQSVLPRSLNIVVHLWNLICLPKVPFKLYQKNEAVVADRETEQNQMENDENISCCRI